MVQKQMGSQSISSLLGFFLVVPPAAAPVLFASSPCPFQSFRGELVIQRVIEQVYTVLVNLIEVVDQGLVPHMASIHWFIFSASPSGSHPSLAAIDYDQPLDLRQDDV
ncbi:uncharacterized protein BO80DRAFT_86437 [Aspergillus ibericus CBS 121593]|uniref:Uncharacterized protein n=1 Tax=Aspergillus ibericus CBS 121593 TaxID=1448316 RepID=A0A395HEQ6_9EURO|nr:hypothetical protein BO80DRAFT_86437 [Aspergillus ibericus CBS 121593]RAL05999.1 hypothetical protein BO80DRAFT_86437 [Aspergillus ibericus CBS 121593]